MADTLPILLRLVDSEEFAKYDCMTPTALDYLSDYKDGVHRMEFQLDRGAPDGTAPDRPTLFYPGGAAVNPTGAIDTNNARFVGARPYKYLSDNNNVLGFDKNRVAGTSYYHKGRGSWKIKELYALNGAIKRKPLVADTDVYVVFEVTEPLLMSPFVFGSGFGKQGFHGFQTMNFQMNIPPPANRAWRSAAWYGGEGVIRKSASIVSFADS